MNIFNMLDRATEKLKEINPETVKLVKRTVTADATDEELALFMYMCYRYNLDPLLGNLFYEGNTANPPLVSVTDTSNSYEQPGDCTSTCREGRMNRD